MTVLVFLPVKLCLGNHIRNLDPSPVFKLGMLCRNWNIQILELLNWYCQMACGYVTSVQTFLMTRFQSS